jgi:hypothetical protein
MSQSAEAAEQIVNAATNVTIKGVECVSNLAGKGAMSLATFLIAVIKEEKKTKGKARMRVFNGKPTKVFVIKAKDMKLFAEEAKKYGVLYAAVFNKKQKDGLVDVVVNAADAAKVNRIAERFALSTVDVERIREEIQKSREEREQKHEQEQAVEEPAPLIPQEEKKQESEEQPILSFQYPKGEVEPDPNPTKQGTTVPVPFASSFETPSKTKEEKKVSVREQIRKMREDRKRASAEKQTPTRGKDTPKRGTKTKTKTKSAKGR